MPFIFTFKSIPNNSLYNPYSRLGASPEMKLYDDLRGAYHHCRLFPLTI